MTLYRFCLLQATIIIGFSSLLKCSAWSLSSTFQQGSKGAIETDESRISIARRPFLLSIATAAAFSIDTAVLTRFPSSALADEGSIVAEDVAPATLPPVQVSPPKAAQQMFNEGRALEQQGNLAAAQRLYDKVTKIAPRFIYGWSNLGNTQTAFGLLNEGEQSYTTAINLCTENLKATESEIGGLFGAQKCNDLYLLLLNRGSLRMNNDMSKEALKDLQQAEIYRGKPDEIVLQNLARAKELNGFYKAADRDYVTAISMSKEVNPFWLRSALVKFQIGDMQGGFDLFKRVDNRFPEAPEVRAAYAIFLAQRGDEENLTAAQQKFLEIPDRQRQNYVDATYLAKTVSWPPAAIEMLKKVTTAVGDTPAES